MGYETRLVFVNTWEKTNGYKTVEATLEMGKICHNEFSKLIDKITTRQASKNEATEKLRDTLRTNNNRKEQVIEDLFWKGEKPDVSEAKEIRKVEGETEDTLEKKLPFIYEDGERQSYEDCYGSVLLVATLEEVKDAIVQDQTKSITEDGKPYRRYSVALAMINEFLNKKEWSQIKVILWGH